MCSFKKKTRSRRYHVCIFNLMKGQFLLISCCSAFLLILTHFLEILFKISNLQFSVSDLPFLNTKTNRDNLVTFKLFEFVVFSNLTGITIFNQRPLFYHKPCEPLFYWENQNYFLNHCSKLDTNICKVWINKEKRS